MNIHNVMEDIVLEKVNELFESEARTHEHGVCTCYQCRLDVAAYVLNRVEPEYVLSGRGLAHLESDYQEKLQRDADLVALITEGIRKIGRTKRPNFSHANEAETPHPEGPYFNYPTIIGRLIDGATFSPVIDVQVELLRDGVRAGMVNPNWQNPYTIVRHTPGTFLFWPEPEPADEPGQRRTVAFELVAEDAAFETFHHFFEVETTSDDHVVEHFRVGRSVNVGDLYIVRK
jgi:competence protein ComFB